MKFGQNFENLGQRDLREEAIDDGLVGRDVKGLPEEVKAAIELEQKKLSRRRFIEIMAKGLAGAALVRGIGRALGEFQEQDEQLEKERLAELDKEKKENEKENKFAEGSHIPLRKQAK